MTQTQKRATQDLIAALRSGKYTRCEKQLRTTSGFCPLGIACDLYDPSRWEELPTNQYQFYSVPLPDDPDEAELYGLPADVADHYGYLADATFTYADLAKLLPDRFLPIDKWDNTGSWSIIELNDNFHLSLRETADVLEDLFLTGHYLGAKEESE